MKYLALVLALFFSVTVFADDGLITRGGGGSHGSGLGGADFNRGGGEFNRGYDNRTWDYGGAYWDGYNGYVLPAPTTYDPLQDPNDDMNQIYQKNLRSMEKTGE